ncbi:MULTISPECIES: hypothetical protein [unclassified Nocardioides]|jgi:hypothetical protein|uniref:hypothetical protein n=1 Tax=unclassified Nocardioides TaxID=2615069 RepID=UPI0007030D7A|nr:MULTISPECIES: hypothetical protein [unclassified Nocardioides]KRC53245.1 hypothetical protein ASE19_12855 [Nocardioides sp. Root79]KRC70582.1 hypothetical protein ASE20_11700 [Nocardioides sp. Root240]
MERDEVEDTSTAWERGEHLPNDARRMGLSPLVPDGAMLEFAGSLDSSKPSHRIVAWVLLVAFLLPVLLTVLRLLG